MNMTAARTMSADNTITSFLVSFIFPEATLPFPCVPGTETISFPDERDRPAGSPASPRFSARWIFPGKSSTVLLNLARKREDFELSLIDCTLLSLSAVASAGLDKALVNRAEALPGPSSGDNSTSDE